MKKAETDHEEPASEKGGAAPLTTGRHGARADFLVVGGGLAGGLVALAKAESGHGDGVTLIEQETGLGGNHTWSFHRTDLDDDGLALVGPLVAHRWPRHEVRFPGHSRTIDSEYATLTSESFDRIVRARLRSAGVKVLLGRRAREVDAYGMVLDDGTELRGDVVLDARGPTRVGSAGHTGFQKFVGVELDLEEDGPWEVPLVMDADRDVEQVGGFRFVYVLPFSRRHVLVEDTVYGDDPRLDAPAVEARALAYAKSRGARVKNILRREAGVLPLPFDDTPAASAEGVLSIGYRGGFFHPVTGYSLPISARVARALAPTRSRVAAREALARVAGELAAQHNFGRLLNRLMFEAMPPVQRWTALARFYQMPEGTIARFYASRSTLWDRARLLAGRPPRGLSWKRLLTTTGGMA